MPHVTRRTSAWSLFVAALLVAGPAGAWQQPPLPTPAVKYRLANEAFDAGRFQAALDGFTDCAERAATATLVCRCQGMAGWASRALGESASAIGWFGQFVASCPPEPLPDGEDPAAWRSMRTSIEDQLPAPAVVEELPPSEPAPEPAPAPAEPAPRAGEVELPPTDAADGADEPWCPTPIEIGGWVGVGSGIATAVAGMAVTILAQDASDRAWALHDIQDELTLDEKRQHNDLIRDAQLRQNLAAGLYIAAGAIAVTGIVLLVLDDRDTDEGTEGEGSTVWLSPAPGGATGGFRATF